MYLNKLCEHLFSHPFHLLLYDADDILTGRAARDEIPVVFEPAPGLQPHGPRHTTWQTGGACSGKIASAHHTYTLIDELGRKSSTNTTRKPRLFVMNLEPIYK